jgi:hypothetical protein
MQHFERGGLSDAPLVIGERLRAMDDPDMAVLVGGDAADLAEDPVIGERFWPRRFDFEAGDVGGAGGKGGEGECCSKCERAQA